MWLLGLLRLGRSDSLAPVFVPLPDDSTIGNWSGRENTGISLTRTDSDTTKPPMNLPESRLERIYKSSSITIEGTTISECYAFGFGLVYGSGGALFGVSVSIAAHGTNFTTNKALNGGSIAVLNSRLVLDKATSGTKTAFTSDIAYHVGGSIYSSAIPSTSYSDLFTSIYNPVVYDSNTNRPTPPDSAKDRMVQMRDVNFSGCQSKEYFGACAFGLVDDLYIEGCTFTSCEAAHSGGAIGVLNSQTIIFECAFFENKAGYKTFNKADSGSAESVYSPDESRIKNVNVPRGGGAIFVITCQNQSQWWNYAPRLEVYTQQCCFDGNKVKHLMKKPDSGPDTWNSAYVSGADILLAGNCYYRSHNDLFQYSKAFAIGEYTKGLCHKHSPSEENCVISIFNFSTIFSVSSETRPNELPNEPSSWKACTFTHSELETDLITSSMESNTDTPLTVDEGAPSPPSEPDTTKTITTPPTPFIITTKSRTIPCSYTISGSMLTKTKVKIQSMTPSFSSTPTCSTGTKQHVSTYTTPYDGFTKTVFTYFWNPSQSPKQSVTSTGASWPVQTEATVISKTPTCSTWDGTAPRSITPATQSYWGEKPNPTATVSISFDGYPSQSLTASVTSTGASWPKQTSTALYNPPIRTQYGKIPPQTYSTLTQSYYGEIPNPTATASISFQDERIPTKSTTPSRSEVPSDGGEYSKSSSITFVDSITVSFFTAEVPIVSFETLSVTYWYDQSSDDQGITYIPNSGATQVIITTYTVETHSVPILIPSEQAVEVEIKIQLRPKEKDNLMLIIIIAVVGVVVVAIIGVLVWWFLSRREKTTDKDEQEMPEETVVEVADSSVAPVTQDNPLWTSNVQDNTDDPFRHDFEEDTNLALTTTTV